MEFGIKKCAIHLMNKGCKVDSEGIRLPEGKIILPIRDTEGCKYLGILEGENLFHDQV